MNFILKVMNISLLAFLLWNFLIYNLIFLVKIIKIMMIPCLDYFYALPRVHNELIFEKIFLEMLP